MTPRCNFDYLRYPVNGKPSSQGSPMYRFQTHLCGRFNSVLRFAAGVMRVVEAFIKAVPQSALEMQEATKSGQVKGRGVQ